MDAPSPADIACCSNCSAHAAGFDEANTLASSSLPLSSSSLPPSYYLQTSPQLLTINLSLSSFKANDSPLSYYSSYSTSMSSQKSSRSTSSPQLMSAKTRSKVYRRASLKSLNSLPALILPLHSKIIKLSSSDNNNDKIPECMQSAKINCTLHGKERLDLLKPSASCLHPSPIFQNNSNNIDKYDYQRNQKVYRHHRYPHHVQHQQHLHKNKVTNESVVQQDNQTKQQSKVKSCAANFLPILSFIPHTVISFQYPTPKIKFSWWRNKIS
ncbi:uncharacterized protein LOC116416227 [Nasonia vitripennis]|uniref:Uncharacterized protein n=1 Tax=Nasonia vitripennis TaxID=7425 RepID=A0A7M7Q257_NASVI|nr:uncharacterized protein LOC116416227 [Nasonia vitripennis]